VTEEHGLGAKKRMLMRISAGCRKLHNEELHNLYAPPNIVREIKSRMMRWWNM
jgi:hypothetical protein